MESKVLFFALVAFVFVGLASCQCTCGPLKVPCKCATEEDTLVKREVVEAEFTGNSEDSHKLVKRQCTCGPLKVPCKCATEDDPAAVRVKRHVVEAEKHWLSLPPVHRLAKRQCTCGSNKFFPVKVPCPCAEG